MPLTAVPQAEPSPPTKDRNLTVGIATLGFQDLTNAEVANPTRADFAVNLQFQAGLGNGFGWQRINTVLQLSSRRTQTSFSAGSTTTICCPQPCRMVG